MQGATIFKNPNVGITDVKKAQMEGTLEAIKELVKERAKNYQRLNALLAKSESVPLYRLSTFWPLKFFPVHIEISSDRINITFWIFMFSGKVISLTTDIIQEVSIESGPLFSALKIETNKPMEPLVEVNYLKKEEAMKARRIIQGLITARKNEVNLENINPKELAEKLEGIGKTKQIEYLIT